VASQYVSRLHRDTSTTSLCIRMVRKYLCQSKPALQMSGTCPRKHVLVCCFIMRKCVLSIVSGLGTPHRYVHCPHRVLSRVCKTWGKGNMYHRLPCSKTYAASTPLVPVISCCSCGACSGVTAKSSMSNSFGLTETITYLYYSGSERWDRRLRSG
jgi:hypothetical protein